MRQPGRMSLHRSGLMLAVSIGIAQAQMLGNLTAREAACSTYSLPASLEKYLDVSFLGERQSVSVGTGNISYFSFGPTAEPGSGTALLMIAGQAATASIWTPPLLSGLSQGRRVVIYDQIGIGASQDSDPPAVYTVDDFAATAAGLVEALDLGQPDVLGWSLGGAVALTLAVQYPDVMSSLVLVDTAPGGPGLIQTPEVAAALARVAMYTQGGSPLPNGLIFPNTPAGNEGLCRVLALQAAMPADAPTTAQVLTQNTTVAAYAGDAGAAEYYGLGNVTAPTLVLSGAQDAILPPVEQQAIFERIPGASWFQFADAGHAAILQHSLTSAALISTFLDAATDQA